MTAVAPPVQLQQPRTSWNPPANGNHTGSGNMSQDESARPPMPATRKSAMRTNSSSSISSTSSNSSASISSAASNGTVTGGDGWDTRKKRGLWPTGKSQPTSSISIARPQSVSSAPSGPSAATGLSALQGPVPQSQPQPVATEQQSARPQNSIEGQAFLYLFPMNSTFARKTIRIPFFPECTRIGRQTNGKTAPTETNGYFDSKVLSRQHAELYAEKSGRIFIRDVKSSNGTFVNGKRLSAENKESEPHELHESDLLELGIDIVSEDQKTVVHHKVAARVECVGIYSEFNDPTKYDPLNPRHGGVHPQMRRKTSEPPPPALPLGGPPISDPNVLQQQAWSRMWVQPISTEHIVRRLNRELTLARRQSQDIERTRLSLVGRKNGGVKPEMADEKSANRSSLSKSEVVQFTAPPAPPPSQPLPEKPDFQPILMRSDTARPSSFEPMSTEQTRALSTLIHELKTAKDQIPSLQDRVRSLEQQLTEERAARVNAEEKAYQLEHGIRKDSAEPEGQANAEGTLADHIDTTQSANNDHYNIIELQSQLDRLNTNMTDMKSQMEAYRRRAEVAENQRDDARQSLAEMIEEKRRVLSSSESNGAFGLAMSQGKPNRGGDEDHDAAANGHTIRPSSSHRQQSSMAVTTLLQKAGVDQEKPLTRQQAMMLQQVLRREMLVGVGDDSGGSVRVRWGDVGYNGLPAACALSTVLLGVMVMRWLNAWEKR